MLSRFYLTCSILIFIIFCLLGIIYYQEVHMPQKKLQRPPQTATPAQKPLPPVQKPLSARIYYIDKTRGSNRATGLSPDNAWQDFTVLRKKKFNPGDKILLKRGETWHSQLVSFAGGSIKKPVIIDAYGSGSRLPTIDVRKEIPAGIRVYHSYLSINNIQVMNAKKTGVDVSVTGGVRHLSLQHLRVINSGNGGIGIQKGGNHVIISDCHIENSKNSGIYLGGSPENRLCNVVVKNCYITGVENNDGITIHEDGMKNPTGSHFLLQNNIAEFCGEQGYDITTGSRILMVNNTSRFNAQGGIQVAHSAENVTISNHTSIDEPTQKTAAAIYLAGEKGQIRLFQSTIRGGGHHLLVIKTHDVAVFNNTFISEGCRVPIDYQGEIDHIHFVNNILFSKNGDPLTIRFLEFSRPPDYPGFHFGSNLYFARGSKVSFIHNKRRYDFNQYRKAYKIEKGSLFEDPGFIDPLANDYRIPEGSPAFDAGMFLSKASPDAQAPDTIAVSDIIFFHAPFTPEDVQCIMAQGDDRRLGVLSVNPEKKTIQVNAPAGQGSKYSLCYSGQAPDIGRHEFIRKSQ